jgi:hypothetical protein
LRIDRRGGCGLGQTYCKAGLVKNNLLPVIVALNLVGVILIEIIIAIIFSRA